MMRYNSTFAYVKVSETSSSSVSALAVERSKYQRIKYCLLLKIPSGKYMRMQLWVQNCHQLLWFLYMVLRIVCAYVTKNGISSWILLDIELNQTPNCLKLKVSPF